MTGIRLALVPMAAAVVVAAAACADGGPAAGPQTTPARSAPEARDPTPGPTPRPQRRALPGLPKATAGFMAWDRINRAPIPPDSPQARRVGVDAHRGVKNVYVRVPRGRRPVAPFPDGTVIVKAAGDDPSRPTLVAVMRKVAGADPANGDWRFAEYTRAAPGEPFGEPLTGAVCWSCHAIASETDWVFTTPGR
ncbi:MAG: cytochrome P460 family protein [Thermoleophilia bacterium]